MNENVKNLFIEISAAFFAIPLIYLFYQTAHNYSQKRLNKEIFDYAKMQVDREVLSIISQLSKLINDEFNFHSLEDLSKTILLKPEEIEKRLSKSKFLGFKVFKNWDTMKNNLQEILKNPYILERLENEQIISIINIIKKLEILISFQKQKDLYLDTGEKIKSHKINGGNNNELPNRYILLKDAEQITNKKNTFIVLDFGDFYKFNLKKLLKYFIINEKYLKSYTATILILSKEINNWIELTGKELIINTNEYRFATKEGPK